MNTQENINYGKYTQLPTKVMNKADRLNPVVEVQTPHKGVVFVEIKKVDKGVFRTATEIDKQTNEVVDELIKLEIEARSFLLQQWLRTQNELLIVKDELNSLRF